PETCLLSDDALADLVDDLTERLQKGEAVDFAAVLAAHPDHADRLAGVLSALGAAAALGGPSGSQRHPGLDGPPPNEELGDFRLVREVGRGGMGVVYEAEQRSLVRR